MLYKKRININSIFDLMQVLNFLNFFIFNFLSAFTSAIILTVFFKTRPNLGVYSPKLLDTT